MTMHFNTVVAQTESPCTIEWEIATILPSLSNGEKQLGLAGPIAGVHKDLLIIGGGANFPDKMPWFGGKKKYYDDIFVFTKNEKGEITSYGEIYKLPFPIAYGASCSTSRGIVYAGGENEQGLSDKVLLIQWNEEIKKVEVKNLPELPFVVANASITSVGNIVYIAGGELSNTVSDTFMALDLDNLSKGWQSMPTLPLKVSHSVMVSQSNGINDCIYIVGGRKRNSRNLTTFYSSVFQFDLKTNLWSQKADIPYPLSAGTGVAVNGKSILLFGGDKGVTFHKAESLIVSINNETDLLKKEKLNQEKIAVQTNHPGFSKSVLEYSTQENTWTTFNVISFNVPVTTTAVVWGNNVIIPTGEIKAGIRTPNILLGHLN